ncbi:MSCRAMM family adhesin SdrC [Fodinisporobacter ferrooxydans]|uniref:MSCRAMM family adhesin SdrC n=1 Tax=Fodinisporobacter ferrooxydans TaxID=2901836 RepID=A0ABY4CHU2_9BACL|nr:MSCRAMM family adhesin SdrC [Alicyclobacillaceae bacterium MYW30-H2]
MANFKVFSEVPSQLLTQVSQTNAASLLSTVQNLTAASLVMQPSNLTAASMLVQPQNLTAASMLVQPQNLTAASMLVQPQNLTAASLVMQPSNLTAASLLVQPSNLTAASLLTQVQNLTAASLLTTLGDRTVVDASQTVSTGSTTFTAGSILTAISLSEVTFTVHNASSTAGAQATLYLSADGTNFSVDPTSTTQTIAAGGQYFFAPGHFVKYMQIMYAAQTAAITAALTIYTQAHV